MSKYVELFNWLRTCPALSDLWSIAATEDIGVRVILPQGASQTVQYRESIDVNGDYECDIVPYLSIYDDFQINCYADYDVNDSSAPQNNINVLTLDEVQSIIDWIAEQNEAERFPNITGQQIVSVECIPRVPQIRYVNPEESTIGYFITLRLRYVNRYATARTISYERNDSY